MDSGGIREELAELHAKALVNAGDTDQLTSACDRMQELVRSAGLTTDLRTQIAGGYAKLGSATPVAVRSSATGEDGDEASFAGMNASYTNIWGDLALMERVVDCWASLFSPRVVSYRASRGFTGEPAIAVVVQQMVPAERAGVIFTADPRTGDRGRIVLEAVFGQGEAIVSGAVEPDTYVVDKEGLRVVSARVGSQSHKIIAEVGGGDVKIALPAQAGGRRVLDDAAVL